MKHDSLIDILRERFSVAVAQVVGTEPGEIDPVLRPAGDPKFGDYQCNVAMSLAKRLKSKPREIAQRIVDAADLEGVAQPPEIAGPGFINIRFAEEFLAGYLGEIPSPPPQSEPEAQAGAQSEPEAPARVASEPEAPARVHDVAAAPRGGRSDQASTAHRAVAHVDRLGMPPVETPQTVVVDYSSPNIAKQMHVGHLRSTIIGDVFARVLDFEGHKVIRQNHLGDWGTQFGRIILSLWHICMARERGEQDCIPEMTRKLHEAREAEKKATNAPPREIADTHTQDMEKAKEATDALLREIVDTHHQDMEKDPDGCRFFHPFLKVALKGDVKLEELERAYQFVSLVEDLARGRGFETEDYRAKGRIPYERLSRHVTAMLQKGGPDNEQEFMAWEDAREITLMDCDEMYQRVGVLLDRGDVCGESFYREKLAGVVADLRKMLVARNEAGPTGAAYAELREDQGAQCVFLYEPGGEPKFKKPDGDELPIVIQKSDGAYLYSTTDLAAIRYRVGELGATRIIYVTDARQKLHFEMFFAAARAVGWAGDDVTLEHVPFGSVQGANHKPLMTRDGENVKLRDLLDEAEKRAHELLESRDEGPKSRRHDESEPQASARGQADDAEPAQRFTDEEKKKIARRVGVAAVKYADLRNDRVSDYVFSWDKMLAFQGNTAPYMMYAYARIRSIYRKAAERFGEPDVYATGVTLVLEHPAERALALRLARLRETIDTVAADLEPHVLCGYLYELGSEFMRFYEACPVLRAPSEAVRLSRMRLCDLTARTLKLGLGLLGIETIERM